MIPDHYRFRPICGQPLVQKKTYCFICSLTCCVAFLKGYICGENGMVKLDYFMDGGNTAQQSQAISAVGAIKHQHACRLVVLLFHCVFEPFGTHLL